MIPELAKPMCTVCKDAPAIMRVAITAEILDEAACMALSPGKSLEQIQGSMKGDEIRYCGTCIMRAYAFGMRTGADNPAESTGDYAARLMGMDGQRDRS